MTTNEMADITLQQSLNPSRDCGILEPERITLRQSLLAWRAIEQAAKREAGRIEKALKDGETKHEQGVDCGIL